jgi:hypothetical protein
MLDIVRNEDALADARQQLSAAESREAICAVLVNLVEQLVEGGDNEPAAQLLTILLRSWLPPDIHARAESLYLDLEARLCPRLMLDANMLALRVTLDEVIAALRSS